MQSRTATLLTGLFVFVVALSGCDSLPNKSSQSYQNSQKTKTEFEKNLDLANEGDADAQFNLGVMLSKGEGVNKDENEAVYWYRKSAEQGNPRAQNNLGTMYENGSGVTKNINTAIEWYSRAFQQGNKIAQYNLEQIMITKKKNDEKSVNNQYPHTKTEIELLLESAQQGDPNAQFELAMKYYEGSNGVKKDYKKAVKWWRKVAEQGNADAQFNVGLMYANGNGVIKDEAEAFKWWHKSAEQGSKDAQLNVGVMYAVGNGVARDEQEAIKWLEKAAKQGEKRAQKILADMKSQAKTSDNVATPKTPRRKLNTKLKTD